MDQEGYNPSWFFNILGYGKSIQKDIIYEMGKRENFFDDEKKDFLFATWENMNSKSKRLAIDILVRYFLKDCDLKICLESQKSKDPNIRTLASKFAKELDEDYLESQLSFLFHEDENDNEYNRTLKAEILVETFEEKCDLKACIESQKSDDIYIQNMGAKLAEKFSKKNLEDQLSFLLETKISRHSSVQRLGALLLDKINHLRPYAVDEYFKTYY
jgi:hypothetical protein